MGSEQATVFNPKHNNRNLLVTTVTSGGRTIKLALLKPGESFRSDRKSFLVTEQPIPAKLTAKPNNDGVFEVTP